MHNSIQAIWKVNMKVAVCEDQILYRNEIICELNSFNKYKVSLNITEFECGEDILKFYESGSYFDIIFLDIEMKKISGIEVAKKIRSIDKNVMIIFVTNYNDFMPDAFEVNAINYLTKPINKEIFQKTLKRSLNMYFESRKVFKAQWKNEITIVPLKDIIYIECIHRHIIIYCKNQVVESKESFGKVESKFINAGFIKVHQSFLVNAENIKNIGKSEVVCSNEIKIPMSIRKRKSAHEHYFNYLKGCSL